MQQLFYDQAPYHILYYDDNLDAYRTDKFAGWQNQPSNGTPLFTYSTLGYTLLTDATAASPTPSAGRDVGSGRQRAGASAAPSSRQPTPSTSGATAAARADPARDRRRSS